MKILFPFFWGNKQKILSPIHTPLQRNPTRKTEALGQKPHKQSIQRVLNYKDRVFTAYYLGMFKKILLQMLP